MQYRKLKDGTEVSVLGYGCMRFDKKGNRIDIDKAEREVMAAIEAGVNYFDTAYVYGGSEEALGTILARNHCREKICIATKLPHYLIKNPKAVDRYFDEQKKRLQTDYIDLYLMHMLPDTAAWDKLCGMGMKEWIEQKKASGEIRHIGFSFHGDTPTFKALIDAYDWDFCQIQYNYLDEHTQAGREGLEYAAAKGIPVVIMEPLRGGRLVKYLPPRAKKLMEAYPVKRSPAEWAFRWLYDQPEVTCVLSGMSSMEMVTENIRVASETLPGEFTKRDFFLIEKVKEAINMSVKVGCTGCAYCMPCPRGVDIPNTFLNYNKLAYEPKSQVMLEYLQITGMKRDNSDVSKCIQCGACEKHCPQHIPIREELKNAKKALMPFPVEHIMKGVRLFMKH